MILREHYVIEGAFYESALRYAELSKEFTSKRHDFHPGGLANKKIKMFEGKLGEKAVEMFFIDNKIPYIADRTPYYERDRYDFLLQNNKEQLLVDVKTRTENFHVRTLEMVEQANSCPKDIYISVRLFRETNTVTILGWFHRQDMLGKNQIENQGYLDNYVMYDRDLRSMEELYSSVLRRFKKL
ncbi:MAG: hypothetical protein HFG78_09545 [Hungatella sp.]|nr:hypothetical protein [Hungatella sp.]MCI9502530.1 hypothetical protein [Hungatella sp.]